MASTLNNTLSWPEILQHSVVPLHSASPWITAALLVLLASYFMRPYSLSKYPLITKKSIWDFGDVKARQEFTEKARDIVDLGIKQVGSSAPFRVVADVGEMLILPPSLADGIRNDAKLSFFPFVEKLLSVNLPGFEPFHEGTKDTLVVDMVRTKLTLALAKVTIPLSREAADACEDIFSDTKDWHELVLKDGILDLVSRLSAKVFLGDEFCHNPAWLRITKAYTVDSFIAAHNLRSYPAMVRRIVHWFLPSMKHVRAQFTEAQSIINPILEKRRAEKAALLRGAPQKEFDDAIEWFEQVSIQKNLKYDPASMQLSLALAAIHTTTDLLTQTMYEIMQNPQILSPLREEIVSVISEGGWKKTTLYNLKLMDSVIKEAQRLKPIMLVNMTRVAMDDTQLPDGTPIPKGTNLGVSSQNLWDPTVFSNPQQFDGYRFLRLREQPGNENAWQLASTRPEHIAFGHGKHACPGRFFAANEVKIALCHLLLKYDWKLADPKSIPRTVAHGNSLDADPNVKVLLRRRQPEIEL